MPCKVSFKYFGDELIRSGDLDPIYIMLYDGGLSGDTLKRWLLAYWCYYSAATASRIAEAPPNQFYTLMWEALRNNWPHGFERRHFRAEQGAAHLRCLQAAGAPERIVDHMTQYPTYEQLAQAVQIYHGFGPWISWKIGDMAERVLGYEVDFSRANLAMYKDPVKGAALFKYGEWEHKLAKGDMDQVVGWMLEDFAGQLAPPRYDRPFNVQEAETCLCKTKAYYKGEYHLGEDIHQIGKGLTTFLSDLGCQLYEHLPLDYYSVGAPYLYVGRNPYAKEVCGLVAEL